MLQYRLYTLSEKCEILSAINRDFDSDAAALEFVIERRRHIEVWCGRRIVARTDHRGQIIPTAPPIFSPETGLRE